eukprot:c14930_g1_i1.p2 GENE.c14930_g1_i1~~c14930_g1_i1.p2  ORF type:complete len:295 (+),score=54.96 c14930_g1_i1:126-887(+)
MTVLLSFLLHYLIFVFAPSGDGAPGDKTGAMFRSRVASFFHSCFVTAGVAIWVSQFKIEFGNHLRFMHGVTGTPDDYMPYLNAVSVGYFASDSLVMLTNLKTVYTPEALAHHIIIGPAFALGLYNGLGIPAQFWFLFEEASTIFLNIKAFSAPGSFINEAAGYAFAVTFLLVRMVFGTRVWLGIFEATSYAHFEGFTDVQRYSFVFQTACCTLSRVMNAYWTLLIARKLLGGGSDKKKGGAKPGDAAAKPKAA